MKKVLSRFGLSAFLLFNSPNLIDNLPREARIENGAREIIIDLVLKDMDKNDYNTAIDRLNLLNTIEPENSDNYSCLGFLYETKGDIEEARTNFRKALVIDPSIANFLHKIAIDYGLKKDYKKAILYYELLSEHNPNNAIYHNLLGAFYHKIGKDNEGLNELSKAIELDKYYANAYLNFGLVNYRIYLETKNKDVLEDAIPAFVISDEIEQNEDAVYNAEKAYEFLKDISLKDNILERMIWEDYELKIRVDYLKSLMSKPEN